jgi:hypothetical protein
MWTPEDAIKRISNGSLLPDVAFNDLDTDALLDARDGSFDDDWIRSAEIIQAAWQQFADNALYTSAIDAAREAAFKRAFNASHGHHDLAATVSDDFEIICKRSLLGIELPFIIGLQEAYDAQQIPNGSVA